MIEWTLNGARAALPHCTVHQPSQNIRGVGQGASEVRLLGQSKEKRQVFKKHSTHTWGKQCKCGNLSLIFLLSKDARRKQVTSLDINKLTRFQYMPSTFDISLL